MENKTQDYMRFMSPEDKRTIEQRLVPLDKQAKALVEEVPQLEQDFKDVLQQLYDKLDAAKTDLPENSTIDKCAEAGFDLVECMEMMVNTKVLRKMRQPVIDRAETYFAKREYIAHFYYLLDHHESLAAKLTEEQQAHVKSQRKALEEPKAMIKRYVDAVGQRDEVILQLKVREMLSNQPLAIQLKVETFLFGLHLRFGQDLRPKVELDKKTNVGLSNTEIPMEIMTMVYKHCDLESAVALRQVGSCWYTAFSACEEIFAHKLRQRNPWMFPEGDLNQWHICVLVFVMRMASDNWTTVQSVNKLTSMRMFSHEHKMLAAELKHDEKLPKTFRALCEHDFPCFSKWCDKVHFGNVTLNPKTLEFDTQQKGGYGCQLVRSTPTETVLSFEGYTITLPAGVQFNTIQQSGPPLFELLPINIVIRSLGRIYVVPRKNPHWRKGFYYDYDEGSFEINNVYVKTNVPYRFDAKNSFHFYNSYKNCFEVYDAPTESRPLANYYGIMYWWMKDRDVTPTFIDQNEPHKLYCKRRSIVTVRTLRGETYEQPQVLRTFGHYIARMSKKGMLLIDLKTGSMTDVQFPDDKGSKMFVGLEEGHFRARYMTQDTLQKYFEQGKKELEGKQ